MPIIIGLAYALVVSSSLWMRALKLGALPDNIEDYHVPTLSQGTLEGVHLVVVHYMPFTLVHLVLLGFLIAQLWAPILALTPMLHSSIKYYTGRFLGAVERGAPYCFITFPAHGTNMILQSPGDTPWTRSYTILSHSYSSLSS